MTKDSTEYYYHVEYCYHNGEADGSGWFAFSDEEIANFRSFEAREREEFLRCCPNDADDADLWHDWLTDAWEELDFTLDDVPYIGVVAEITWIDLDNPQEHLGGK